MIDNKNETAYLGAMQLTHQVLWGMKILYERVKFSGFLVEFRRSDSSVRDIHNFLCEERPSCSS